MSNQEKATGGSDLPAAQQRQGAGITDKVGGVVNVIHGTGEVIRGHALDAMDFGHGDGKAIIAAGKDEVQRGRDKIAGSPTATSAAATSANGHASNQDWGGAADWGTASAAENGTYGRSTSHQYHEKPTAATASLRDRPTAADDPNVQRDTDVRQQGNWTGSTDRDEATRTTANTSYPQAYTGSTGRDEATRATANTSYPQVYPANAVGQEKP